MEPASFVEWMGEPPLAARILPPAFRAAAAGAKIARAGFRALEGIGRCRLDRSADRQEARQRGAEHLRATFAALARIHSIDPRVSGEIPKGPAVLVSNHLGYLDPLVICSLVPTLPVAKREVGGWPLIGGGARSMGVLFVDRALPHSGATVLREALRCLEAGVPVLCFPEGTTTTGSRLHPFRRGIFGAARLAGVPVVPIAIRYDDPALCWVNDDRFLPHYLATAARPSIGVRVRFGGPIEAAAHRSAAELAAEARDRVAALYGSL